MTDYLRARGKRDGQADTETRITYSNPLESNSTVSIDTKSGMN